MPPSIYNISADRPFLDTLVAGLLRRAGGDPLALARMTVLLPTRRAGRSLREAFLRNGNGASLLLPKMVPIGDLDPEELGLLPNEADAGGTELELPPAVPELRRRLMLTRLVLAWGRSGGGGPLSAGQAAPLAAELARFLDEVQAEGLGFDRLADLVPADCAKHWQDILKFLAIVTTQWPKALAEIGCLDPAERRNLVLGAQAAVWRSAPPREPVIAAGITGGIPAILDLVAVVAGLNSGAVVLPGLDVEADGASWEEITKDPAHPQHLMARFLGRIEVAPKDVKPWLPGATPPPRLRLIGEALTPASLSHRWRFNKNLEARAVAGIRRLDCPGPQAEALVIALLLRERLEAPGKTAALVTPDRDLARRVVAELRRWNIDIDDSAGVNLDRTPSGAFLRLVLELAAEDMAPVPLLACLKHPLAAGGLSRASFRERVRRLERAALRGPRPDPGAAGLRALLAEDDHELRDLVARLERATAGLVKALSGAEVKLSVLVAAHIAAAEALAASDREPGAATLWREPAGEAAALFLNELLQAAADFPPLPGAEYPGLFEALLAGPVVRPPYGRHPRLFIWGLLEARLQRADLMVLGGLNEGVWPASAEGDPWLSRPMRQQFGLPPPERRIGMAALDFALGLAAPEVVVTRASRVEGTPTVPSRWLLRLDTVLRALGLGDRLADASALLSWQDLIDAAPEPPPAAPPAPTPPLAARPRRLSVTEIETWRRDPYAIYAKHVLRLRALEPIDADPGLAERGLIIHDALAKFLRAYPERLPKDAASRLVALGKESFGTALDRPGVWAFWWPRFLRIADWVVAEEDRRRELLMRSFAEIDGAMTIEAPGGQFMLTGRADRIELGRDGTIALIDYKTGGLPGLAEIAEGFAPQLLLEAAIIEQGGFSGIAAAKVGTIAYWRLTGGDPAGEMRVVQSDPAKLRALIDDGRAWLDNLVAAFDDPHTPYRAVPAPERAPRYSDYAHLERVKEWLASAEAEE